MFAWLREDPEALVVWVENDEEKTALLDSDPVKFFTTDHYDGHPIVLVHLGHVDLDEARELTERWSTHGTRITPDRQPARSTRRTSAC